MKKFTGIKPMYVVATFASAMLILTGCSSSNGEKPQTGQEATQRQIDAIPPESGIHYIADKRTGFCFAAQYMVGFYKGSVALTRVPCTKEVLALIPNPEDRPGYTPQCMPAPSSEP